MPNIVKPRIVHVIANFMTGGSSQLVVDLIRGLGGIYEQEVLTSYKPDPPAYPGVTICEYPFSCFYESLVDYFKKSKPDLIHVHYWGDCDFPWYDKVFKAAAATGCKIVENINTPIEPYVADTVSRYIYVSEYVLETFGEKSEKSTVIYPGSDFTFFRRDNVEEMPDDCIGMVYRLETDKLNEKAIDPFIKVAQRRPKTKVLIVGGGTYLAPYQEAVKRAGVSDSFVFTGYAPYDNLPGLYRQMSVFVAPVWKESFGQVSPFAMSHGIPVVGYNIGALKEIIGTEELLAPPADADKLADIIIELLEDREKRLELGRLQQQRAHSMFSLEAMIEGYRKVYTDVIGSTLHAEFLSNVVSLKEKQAYRVALFVHCFFPDHFYGTEAYTLNVAKNLRILGYDPVVITAKFPGEPSEEELITYYEYDGIPVYCIDKNVYPHRRVKDTYYQEEMRPVLEGLLIKIQPDIVHVTHLINHTGVLLEVTESLGIPTLATMTDFFGHCLNNKLQYADGSLCYGPDWLRANCLNCFHAARIQAGDALPIEKRLIRYSWLAKLERFIGLLPGFDRVPFANAVSDVVRRPDILADCYAKLQAAIVPTRFTQKMYEQNDLRVPLHNISFGIDIDRGPKPKRSTLTPVRFGFIGQIDYHKGTDILIEAFRRLPAKSAELYIYGSEKQAPAYFTQLKAAADGLPVHFCGTFPQEKTRDVLDQLDFIVIPSRWYENSPLILLSALASHTPVIVSNVEGMTEFITAGKDGFTFRLGDTDELETIMRKIITMPAIAAEMAERTEYKKDSLAMTQETVKIYEELLSKEK